MQQWENYISDTRNCEELSFKTVKKYSSGKSYNTNSESAGISSKIQGKHLQATGVSCEGFLPFRSDNMFFECTFRVTFFFTQISVISVLPKLFCWLGKKFVLGYKMMQTDF